MKKISLFALSILIFTTSIAFAQSVKYPKRTGIVKFAECTLEEQAALIQENPLYGNIICRCETVTEGEIVDAIHRPITPRSIDAVKRRCRAGMGRCQSGFCSPRTIEILARERGVDMSEITKAGGDSKIIVGVNKDRL